MRNRSNPLDLIHIQLELECIGVNREGFLFRIPCTNPDDIARFFVARHATGYIRFIRHDVAPHIIDQLRTPPQHHAFTDIEHVKQIISADAAGETDVWRGRAYTFQHLPEPAESSDVVLIDDRFTIISHGKPVSWAWSSRSNARAAELAVETLPAFQRRGYARQVASAWARHELERGKVAFYSHRVENQESQALAASLGVVLFMDSVAYI
jgi:GNAT superfamily N-acetyltransferase